MTDTEIPTALLRRLANVDTPTACNAIEVAKGRRGFANFTRRTMHWSGPAALSRVGFARTARIAGATPPTEPMDVLRARRRDYFRSMAAGPRPGLAVIEDIDGDGASGAWWGEIHGFVHARVCGLAGAVTNGLMRDLGDLPPDFPILAGGVGPSHAHVHVRDIGSAVEIHGMRVAQGDLVHADRHGALVVPPDVIASLGAALDRLETSENLVLGPLRAGPVTLDVFEASWAAFEKTRT